MRVLSVDPGASVLGMTTGSSCARQAQHMAMGVEGALAGGGRRLGLCRKRQGHIGAVLVLTE